MLSWEPALIPCQETEKMPTAADENTNQKPIAPPETLPARESSFMGLFMSSVFMTIVFQIAEGLGLKSKSVQQIEEMEQKVTQFKSQSDTTSQTLNNTLEKTPALSSSSKPQAPAQNLPDSEKAVKPTPPPPLIIGGEQIVGAVLAPKEHEIDDRSYTVKDPAMNKPSSLTASDMILEIATIVTTLEHDPELAKLAQRHLLPRLQAQIDAIQNHSNEFETVNKAVVQSGDPDLLSRMEALKPLCLLNEQDQKNLNALQDRVSSLAPDISHDKKQSLNAPTPTPATPEKSQPQEHHSPVPSARKDLAPSKESVAGKPSIADKTPHAQHMAEKLTVKENAASTTSAIPMNTQTAQDLKHQDQVGR